MTSRVQNEKYIGDHVSEAVKVPYSLTFNALPKPISGNIRQVYTASSSSNTLNPGDTLRFEILARDYLIGNTLYIKFDFNLVASAASAAVTLPSSSIFFRRMTINIGSTQIDNISEYGKFYSALLKMNGNTSYTTTDGTFEGINSAIPAAGAAGSRTYTYVMPITSTILDSIKYLPLDLFGSSNLVIQLELDTWARINNITTYNFTITNPKIYYELLDPGMEYKRSIREQLAQVGSLRIPYVSVTGNSFGLATGTFSQQIAESCSSLLGVLMVRQTGLGGDFPANGFTSLEVRVDGTPMPNYLIDSYTQSFTECQRLFSALWDQNSCSNTTYANYSGGNDCVLGVSFKRFHDGSLSGVGVPCMQGVRIEQIGNSTAGSAYVWLLKEYDLVIDVSGSTVVRR